MSSFRLRPSKWVKPRQNKNEPEIELATEEEILREPVAGSHVVERETTTVEDVKTTPKMTKKVVEKIKGPSSDIADMARDTMLQTMYGAQSKKWEMELEDMDDEQKRRRARRERREEQEAPQKPKSNITEMLMMMGGMDPDRIQEMMGRLDGDTLMKMQMLGSDDPQALLLFSLLAKEKEEPTSKNDSSSMKDFLDFYKVMLISQQAQAKTMKEMVPPPQKSDSFSAADLVKLLVTMQKQDDKAPFYQTMMEMTQKFQDSLRQRDTQLFQMQLQDLQSRITNPKDWLSGVSGDIQNLQQLIGTGRQRTPEEIQLDREVTLRKMDMVERGEEREDSRTRMGHLMETIEKAIDTFGEQLGKPLGEVIASQAKQPTSTTGQIAVYDQTRAAEQPQAAPSLDELNAMEQPSVVPIGSQPPPAPAEPKKRKTAMDEFLESKWG